MSRGDSDLAGPIVAIGDSITRGKGGYPVLGMHPQSWVQWVAETLGEPLLNLGVDGATAPDMVRDQLPRLGGARFGLGTLYAGANDARSPAFDAAVFDHAVGELVAALAAACDHVLVLTLPLELGRPSAGPDVRTANDSLRRHAVRAGATVCELTDFHGPRVVLPDAVHPTTPGMVAIADRALAALGTGRRVDAGERRALRPRWQYGTWYLRQHARKALGR